MVVYNIFLGKQEEELWKELDVDFVSGLVSSAVCGSEYGLFTLELLLKSQGWVEKYYPKLDSQQRYFILDLMSNNTSEISDDSAAKESRKFNLSAVVFISNEFRSHSDHILDMRTGSKVENIEGLTDCTTEMGDPCEISKWLEVLASASGNEEYLSVLQADGPLLVQAVFLLKSIQLVGKLAEDEGDLQHPFVPIQKLSTMGSSQSESDVEMHPAHGFKRNLVRLIGNLAWKNKEIQNKVLELEAVPLILDCCNIDERNPFITQWAIMAIRNLCDGNHEVQNVIGGLKREGVVSNDLLKEMGLTLHDSGNPNEKISIVPLPR
ncbi:ataxin-10 isoform X2 [Hetaerina americana]